jgi:hypothetical protein
MKPQSNYRATAGSHGCAAQAQMYIVNLLTAGRIAPLFSTYPLPRLSRAFSQVVLLASLIMRAM